MGKKSKDKGYRGENELVHFLRDHGWNASRVPLSGSASRTGCGDVLIPSVFGDRAVEVKRAENLPGWIWKELKKKNAPALCMRKNNEEWLITLPLTEFLVFMYCGLENSPRQNKQGGETLPA